MLTDEQLAELLAQPESDRAERKRSGGDRSVIRAAICALTNDLPGHGQPGAIFVGVSDDGPCANMEITGDLLGALAQMHSDGDILPLQGA